MCSSCGLPIVNSCLERYQILSFASTYIRWFSCLGVSFRILMERGEFIEGGFFSEELWEPVRFSVWRLQCANYSCESSRPYRLFSLCHYCMIQKQFVHLSIYYLTMITNNVCSVFVFLHSMFSSGVLLRETVLVFLCSLVIDCSFLVFSDSWSRTSMATFWKWLLLSSFCKCNCFSDMQCYLCSSIVGLE